MFVFLSHRSTELNVTSIVARLISCRKSNGKEAGGIALHEIFAGGICEAGTALVF